MFCEKTKDFLNIIVKESISNHHFGSRSCGLVASIEHNEYNDTIVLVNVLNIFFVGGSISDTELYINCPQVIQVLGK